MEAKINHILLSWIIQLGYGFGSQEYRVSTDREYREKREIYGHFNKREKNGNYM